MTKHGLSGAADSTVNYAYPAAGTAHAHELTGATGGGTSSFLDNNAGQTINMTVNGLSTDIGWDDYGRVASTTVHAAGGDKVTSYLYDAGGGELLQKTANSRTLYLGGTEVKTDAAGTIVGATRRYIVDGVVVATRTAPGGLSWQAADHQDTGQVSAISRGECITGGLQE